MGQHLSHQLALLRQIPPSIKANDPPASLQTVSRHLELVHSVNVEDVELDAGAVGGLGGPHVQVFVSTGFKVESVVARVQVRQLVHQVEGVFGIQFGIYIQGRVGCIKSGIDECFFP